MPNQGYENANMFAHIEENYLIALFRNDCPEF